jgi:putative membrane-bound dehydrogenase-like protein
MSPSLRFIPKGIAAIAFIFLTPSSSLWAAPKPLRIAYLDCAGVEKLGPGSLHSAMKENGRDAIYFDYYGATSELTKELASLYDAILVRGDAQNSPAIEQAKAANQVLPVLENQTGLEIREAVLKAVSASALSDWKAFLAQREPEVREPNPNVANYEKRPEPLTFQKPYSLKGSMERIQVPADMHLELFADAPQIGKPIAMAWDARGRCWVACTSDYPHGVSPDNVGNDKIVICEDTDGDGKADKFTVFADKLNIPTGLCFTNGGLIVSQPPNFVFLKDTDGDDKADVREVILTGWGIGDTHAQASNLHYGYDNWLYGAVGYSGFKGTVGGKALDFRQGTYRFTNDGSRLEFLHQFSNNTWAQSYNDAGDDFGGTANNAPLFYGGIPVTALPAGRAMSAKKINVVSEAHTITPNYRQVDVFNGYTAAAGASFAYSANLPSRFQGKALVCEPTMKLVALFDVQPDGAGYKALDAMNIFASSDEWTSPVYAEVGPDGAVWVADWQNFIIQHNPTPSPERGGYKANTGVGGAHENELRDHERGRIYRIVANSKPKTTAPSLEGKESSTLVNALNNDVQYTRLLAQRSLVEGKKTDSVPALKKIVLANDGTIGAVHALWALHGLGALDDATHKSALFAADDKLRRNAIRALGTDDGARTLFFGSGVLADREPHTRLAAWVRLADFPTTPEIQKLVRGLAADPATSSDEWLREATRMLAKRHSTQTYTEGPNLLPNAGLETLGADGFPEGWIRRDYNPKSGPDFAEWKSSSAKNAFHSGVRALTVSAKDPVDTSFHAEAPLKPNTDYKMSAWVRAKGLKGKVSLNDNVGRAETDKLTKDSDWTEVETTFNSGDKPKASVNLLFVGKGEAIFDDIKLVELIPLKESPLLAADPKRGEAIFLKHPTAACVLCHALHGQGSNVGPALDGIASRQNAEYIKQSLLEPNAVLAKGYEYLQVSPMPAMGLILSPQELEDIQAFLQTLK